MDLLLSLYYINTRQSVSSHNIENIHWLPLQRFVTAIFLEWMKVVIAWFTLIRDFPNLVVLPLIALQHELVQLHRHS